MRFLPASKLDQIFRSSLSHLWGRTGSSNLVGTQKWARPIISRHFQWRVHDHHARVYSAVPCRCVRVSHAGYLRGFLRMGWRLSGTAAEVPRWGYVGTEVCPRQEVSVSLIQVWRAWRSKDLDSFFREMRDYSAQKCHSGLPWRPAVFVSLADKKGQVETISDCNVTDAKLSSMDYGEASVEEVLFVRDSTKVLLQSLVLLVGEAYLCQDRNPVLAEQLHGKWELSSQRRASGFKTVYRETVEAVMLLVRAIYLLVLFAPCLIVGALVKESTGQLRAVWMNLLLRSLESAGPAFIKWGQWASTRPDIFPPDICEELSKLHMQAPRHSYAETRRIMQKAFRKPIEEIFDDFEEEPVASGSIAQIHRAVLKKRLGDGPPLVVAVKVRHPRVSELIQRDFVIIKLLARFSTLVPGLQHLQLDKSVQHFASFMTRQVDLTLEAAHLQRFIYNFRKSKDVTFPAPIYPYVHPTVLVETFEEGQTVANFVDTGALSSVCSRLAYIGSNCLLKMMLTDNFIHGDLHPGNIFVRFDGNVPKVILLDVGMTAELNARSRDILLKLFKAVALKNGHDVATWTLQFTDDQSCPDPESVTAHCTLHTAHRALVLQVQHKPSALEAFKRDVDAKFKEYLSVRGTAKNTGECMTELFDQIRKHRVNMDGDVCTVMVTTLVLEGWQRKLDPDLDVFQMLGSLLLRAEWAVSFNYTMAAVAAP